MTETLYVPKYKYVYIAAPYSTGDQVINVREVIMVADQLVGLGYVPFVPHLSMLWHLVSPHGIDFWYDLDIEWLFRCEALLRLPGESRGADNEVQFALEQLAIPVFYSVDELLAAEVERDND